MREASTMVTVYVAGPYRSKSREGVQMNIQSAMQVGKLACLKGWSPVVPHANTAMLDELVPELGDQFWLDATMELMRRCDAVVLAPGWQRSEGVKGELNEADRLGIPIYRSEHELPYAAAFLEEMEADRITTPIEYIGQPLEVLEA